MKLTLSSTFSIFMPMVVAAIGLPFTILAQDLSVTLTQTPVVDPDGAGPLPPVALSGGNAMIGGYIRFDAAFGNLTAGDSTNVMLVATLPANTLFVGALATGGVFVPATQPPASPFTFTIQATRPADPNFNLTCIVTTAAVQTIYCRPMSNALPLVDGQFPQSSGTLTFFIRANVRGTVTAQTDISSGLCPQGGVFIPANLPPVACAGTPDRNGNNNTASASALIVALPPAITKAFGAPAFPLGATTTLTFTLTNPNAIPVTGVAFSDILPTGLSFPAGAIVNSCFLAGSENASSVTVTGGTIPANGTCTLTYVILGTTVGVKVNTSSLLTTTEAPQSLNPATATVIVAIPPTISKAFGVAVIPLNGVTTLTITITNPNATTALSGVAVTDNFPAGLLVANPNGLVNTCGGTVTATAGTGSVILAGGVIPISGTCTITVNVTGVATGLLTNTTGNVTSTEGGTDGTATASITVGGNFLISYAANLTSGDGVINLTNTGANGAALNGPGFGGAAGNICMNVYAFSPDEQLVSCCSCLVTPNGLASLSVNQDLISNTLTGVRPNSIVVKVVPTGAGATFTGTACTNSAAVAGQNAANPLIATGALGFGTTVHAQNTGFATTENPLRQATLSAQELASITNRCTNIIGNGSTFGICRSCRVGGLSASR